MATRSASAHNDFSTHKRPYHQPKTVDELTRRNVETIVKLDEAAKAHRTPTDRMVDSVAAFCAHMGFVYLHISWFAIWIAANTVAPFHHFDPYPFSFLTFTVSLEAIFLSSFILISQNRESEIAERRNQLDLQVNLLAEQENTKLLEMVHRISQKLGVEVEDDPTVEVLKEATQPDELVKQIEESRKQTQANEAGAQPK